MLQNNAVIRLVFVEYIKPLTKRIVLLVVLENTNYQN